MQQMLPLEVIKKYYSKADEELKEVQEVVYLLACAVMQEFYGTEWMSGFEEIKQGEKGELKG